MFYKVLNKLFGWNYIYWYNSADQGIARVFVSRDGKVYYWRYKSTKLMDIVTDPKDVVWLTCRPEKYFYRAF